MMRFVASFSVWLFLLVLLTFTSASGGERPKIIVGGDQDNPPYEFLENGKPTGFNIELMRMVAAATGQDVEFRLGPWSTVRQELELGKIDSLAGMYYSPSRSQMINFSVPHTMVTSGIFVRKDSPINSLEDIKGKEVIVQKGDVIHDYLRQHSLTPHIFTAPDPEETLRILASGKHDCALMPSMFQGEYLIKKLKLVNIRVISADLPQLRYCFAVGKGNRALQYRLDEGLNILHINGKYRKIYEKWFGVYEQRDLWETIKYYVLALVLSLVLCLVFLIWSGTLKRQVDQRTFELRQARDELEERVEKRTQALRNANRLLQQFNRALSSEVEARREAEEASIQSISLLKATLESTADGILVVDSSGRIVDFNEKFLELWHIPRNVIVSQDDVRALAYVLDQLRNPDEFIAKVKELYDQPMDESLDFLRFKDGRVFERYSRPRRVVNQVTGRVWSFRDITDRMRADEDLRQANLVVENSPVVLFRCKAAFDWPVELVSRNVIQFGYTPEEFLSGAITYSSIIYPQDLERVISEMQEYTASGVQQLLQEYRIVTKCGDIRWIIDQTACERNGAGEITHYQGVIIDVTDRKRAEEALRESEGALKLKKKMLEELNSTLERRVQEEVTNNREKDIVLIQQNRQAALGEMLDQIAHQWKQPLNSIYLIIQDLKESWSCGELTDENVKEAVTKTMALVDHMAQTIDVFRDFYRPEKEQVLFRLKKSIDSALSFMAPTLRLHGIVIEIEVDPDLSVIGYPNEYAQVLLNIITNARDMFKERKVDNPVLKIEAFAENDKAVVAITDNAGGIPESIIDKIFDLYFTTRESKDGSGIGLYMSNNIIEKNVGGKLSAANVDGGAQFRIELNIPGC